MNLIVFICALFGLVGNKSSKGMETQHDYFLASKGLTFFPRMMTFIATQVSGGAYAWGGRGGVLFWMAGVVVPIGGSIRFAVSLLGFLAGEVVAAFRKAGVKRRAICEE